MSPQSAKPFGRRGVVVAAQAAPAARVMMRPPAANLAPDIAPEVIAAVMGPRTGPHASAASRPAVARVGWSFRAAVLAGLIVGLLNAAARATTFLSFGSLGTLGRLTIGNVRLAEAGVPISLLIALGGLWSGARASAWTLLFAHKFLSRRGLTSFKAYSLCGAAACLAYAFLAAPFGGSLSATSLFFEAASGLGAGFFYRLFALTERG